MHPTAGAIETDNAPRLEMARYLHGTSCVPLFVRGDAVGILSGLDAESIDFCMTSPPYWAQRSYHAGGIGGEGTPDEFIQELLRVFQEVHRVLKRSGSFWLNLGDTYHEKRLLGIPWRTAFALTDRQGWVLRNSVIWHKVKGGLDGTKDRLRNVHENVFHFVKSPRDYFYDADAIRRTSRKARIVNGSVVSATGVSGVRYRRQIELAPLLSDGEKRLALDALESVLQEVRDEKISDFRMVIRGQQRTTHSDSASVSGRAREIEQKGFYFLRYHPGGSKPSDVWDILPEDTQKRDAHFAPYPEDLCKIPILSTCPVGGTVLDPFCGTGTTMLAAYRLGRKSIGIDLSRQYVENARERCNFLL
ncbi:MAG: DNA-methyltransferase [Tepidisphaeraceae bacterium]